MGNGWRACIPRGLLSCALLVALQCAASPWVRARGESWVRVSVERFSSDGLRADLPDRIRFDATTLVVGGELGLGGGFEFAFDLSYVSATNEYGGESLFTNHRPGDGRVALSRTLV